jgi:two-component system chemotaxis response regulator CheB
MKKKIKVLIVDDSAVVRQTLTEILSSDRQLEVVATAADPYFAADKMRREVPDVITLDIEMPRMDGLTFLQKIMSQRPMPVVVCSSVTEEGSEAALKALEYGAVEIIHKPRMGTRKFLEESTIRICDAVKAASQAKLKPIRKPFTVSPKLTADAVISRPRKAPVVGATERVVVVGASTGGTEALRVFLEAMPHDSSGILVVQHMPEKFTKAFARRIDGQCHINVKEAEDGDNVFSGQALIAPGNRHMLLRRVGSRYRVEVKDGPLVCRHRPSVDVLFRSAAKYAGKNAVGVIMTGMGDDGAKGMLELKEAGAFTVAQDAETCVVFGMPNEAIKLGAVDKVLPLEEIAGEVMGLSGRAIETVPDAVSEIRESEMRRHA